MKNFVAAGSALTVPAPANVSAGAGVLTLDEIEAFEKAHHVGTTPRLALALSLYTGQRRADLRRAI